MNESNPFAVAAIQSGNISIAQSRAAQEVQASMVIAKKFPRNEEQCIERIRRSCGRHSLAEVATYAYPRGGTTVTGASIRLAECLAQHWMNIEFGIVELEQRDGESTVMAFAHDLETNSRQMKIFQVRHERRVGKGDDFRIDKLTDARDIYEMVANQGARRLRSCILGIIPGDVTDIALEQCEKTLASGNKEPLIDRVRKMAAAFGEFGVVVAMLEKRLGHKLEATIEQELVGLRKIFVSLKDGMSKREDWFDLNAVGITRPKFDEADKADEKAEAAAGLAPAQAPEPPKRGRPKKEAAAPATQPAAKESPTAPQQPAETPPAQPQPTPSAGGELLSSPAYGTLRDLMSHSQVTEAELFAVCKQRGLMEPGQEELRDLSDHKLAGIAEMWPAVAGQIRINRTSRGK